MTTVDRRKQLLTGFIRQIWGDGDAETANSYIAETCTIHHDPGDP